jgi:hypothetical protein
MIKNKFKTKILLLIICLLVMLISTKKKELQIKEEVIYTGLNVYPAPIYLIDKDNYLAKTEVELEGKTDLDKAREIIEILINDGKYEEKIPNGFKSVISSNTKIIDISLKDKILKINFNSSLLEINENKVIESLTYSLTSQENIDGIIIFISLVIFKNVELTLFGVISLFISSFAVDFVIGRFNISRIAFIITEKGDEISQYLVSTSPRGVTIIDVIGAYTNDAKKMLFCALKEGESDVFQRKILEIDSKAFIVFSESQRIKGNGFYLYK